MPDVMVQGFMSERELLVARIENAKGAATTAGRDLSAQDMETISNAKARLAQIDEQLEVCADDYELNENVRAKLSRVHSGVSAPPRVYGRGDEGQVLWDFLHRSQNRDAAERVEAALTRAAQHMGTVAADTATTAGDLAGLVVDPIVGPVVNFYDTSRPFLNAIGVQSVSAYDFRRPYLTDAKMVLATVQAAQTSQKTELPSDAFSIASDTLEMVTYGGYLNVSQQLMSFQPQSLGVIVQELRNRVAKQTEKAALTELASSTTKVTLATNAAADVVLKAIYDGNAKVYDETGSPATWIAFGPTGLARLGALVDSALRPFFPSIGAANASGTVSTDGAGSIAGLRPIQTYAITDVNLWVGNSGCFEAYEYPFPMLTAADPSLLGTQVAVAVGFVPYRPRSKSGQLGATHLAP
jgi:HK97 family phage major capsid protein